MAQAIPAINTAEGVLALLAEDDDALKVYALQQINASIHQFWHQASGSIATIEALFEDEEFSHRELAALVASKARRLVDCPCVWGGPCVASPCYCGVAMHGVPGCNGLHGDTQRGSTPRTQRPGRRTAPIQPPLHPLPQIFYYLGDLQEAQAYALGAGALFDVDSPSAFERTILDSCLDAYVAARAGLAGDEPGDAPASLDPRLAATVQRVLDRCLADGQHEQAVGIALEARRLDVLAAAVLAAADPPTLLAHALDAGARTVVERGFRRRALATLVGLYKRAAPDDAPGLARGLAALEDGEGVAALAHALLRQGGKQVKYERGGGGGAVAVVCLGAQG